MLSWLFLASCSLIFSQTQAVMSEDVELNNKCTYSAYKRILNCVGLERMNKNLALYITPDTQMVFLRQSKNAIFHINDHNHPNFSNLISFQIINSSYFLVQPGAFLGLSNVQYMEIHENVWLEIESDSFIGLRNLEILNLAENQIRKLNTLSFNHLAKLRNLDLSQNSLEVIPSHVFEKLNELDALYINNNLIKIIEEHAFLGLPQLSMIFLTNNSLEYTDAIEFNKIKNLGHLHLNFNRIKTINGSLKLRKLKFLQLSHNELSQLENNVFEQCSELLSVDLSKNNLRDLTEQPFLRLRKLWHLNLYDNFVDLSKFSQLKVNTTIIHN